MAVIILTRADSNPYAQIPNDIIRDPRLTSNAFRLLAYLMSHKTGYELSYKQITTQINLKTYAIDKARDLLAELGLISWERPKRNDGKYANITWTVLDRTIPNDSIWNDSIRDDSTMEQLGNNKKTNLEKTNLKKPISKRETFSEDWTPDENQLARIKSEYPDLNIDVELQKMIDWILATGRQKECKDMAARFRNWVRTADERSKRYAPKNPYDGMKRI